MIFQDPYSSLNPRMTVSQIVEEPLKIHTKQTPAERQGTRGVAAGQGRAVARDSHRYPHEFSGGQRQRIGIARALATNPKIIIADEPVSALDVSIQAQVINLMQDLQEEFGLSYIFIAHDLSVVRHISDRIAVMFWGISWRSAMPSTSTSTPSTRTRAPCSRPCPGRIPIEVEGRGSADLTAFAKATVVRRRVPRRRKPCAIVRIPLSSVLLHLAIR